MANEYTSLTVVCSQRVAFAADINLLRYKWLRATHAALTGELFLKLGKTRPCVVFDLVQGSDNNYFVIMSMSKER